MKKVLLTTIILAYALITTGCSKTWSGVKQDTSELVLGTQEAIHEVTAPTVMQDSNVDNSVQNTRQVAQSASTQNLNPYIPTAR